MNIENYLTKLRALINNNAKIILSSRSKNMFFCEKNNIDYERIKQILLNLDTNDFCKVLNNKGINGEEKLYLFAPSIILKNGSTSQMYIKINMIVEKNVIVLISFHKSKYELKTLFNSEVDNKC